MARRKLEPLGLSELSLGLMECPISGDVYVVNGNLSVRVENQLIVSFLKLICDNSNTFVGVDNPNIRDLVHQETEDINLNFEKSKNPFTVLLVYILVPFSIKCASALGFHKFNEDLHLFRGVHMLGRGMLTDGLVINTIADFINYTEYKRRLDESYNIWFGRRSEAKYEMFIQPNTSENLKISMSSSMNEWITKLVVWINRDHMKKTLDFPQPDNSTPGFKIKLEKSGAYIKISLLAYLKNYSSVPAEVATGYSYLRHGVDITKIRFNGNGIGVDPESIKITYDIQNQDENLKFFLETFPRFNGSLDEFDILISDAFHKFFPGSERLSFERIKVSKGEKPLFRISHKLKYGFINTIAEFNINVVK